MCFPGLPVREKYRRVKRQYTVSERMIRIRHGGLSLRELAEKIGVPYETVKRRHHRGWTSEEMLAGERKRGYRLQHNGERKTIKEWSQVTGIKHKTILHRMREHYDAGVILKTNKETQLTKEEQ